MITWLQEETAKVMVQKERFLDPLLMGTFAWASHAK